MTGAGPRRRRSRQLVGSLPDALGHLAGELRGGGTVHSGLAGWAAGAGPLAEDAAGVLAAVDGGATLPAALAAWRSRPGSPPEVGVVAGALEVCAVVGGRSADSADALARCLRDAADVRGEARSLSAQARLSAVVVGLAPLATLIVSGFADRRLPAALFGTSAGRTCLAAGVGLELAGAFLMARTLRVPG